jgi:HAD superfamily hydrolase (TIGR01490 family)
VKDPPRLAIFDIDGTLIVPSTGLLLARGLKDLGVASWGDVARGAWFTILMRMHRLRYEDVVRHALGFLVGHHVDEVRRWFEHSFERHMRRAFVAETVDRLKAHHRAGDTVVLLSGTSQLVGEIICRVLPVDDLVCSDVTLKDGCITDEIHRPFPYGRGKVHWGEVLAQRAGLPLDGAIAYSDSLSDLPLLEAVATPVAVKPDPFLRRLAARRGWEVIGGREKMDVGSCLAE